MNGEKYLVITFQPTVNLRILRMTKENIFNEAKRIEEDCNYSSKGHFYASHRWHNLHFWLGLISCIAAGIAGASALSAFTYHGVISGTLSIIAGVLTAILTFINPNQRSAQHYKAGNKYLTLRNDARIFYNVELDKLHENKSTAKLKELNHRRSKLNSNNCQIPRWAFKKARKGIEQGESIYKIDK